MNENMKKYGLIAAIVLVVAGAIGLAITKHGYDAELARLRNEVATRDATIEVQKGVYEKLALESDDLLSTLKERDDDVKRLAALVYKKDEDLLAANQLALRWKRAYEAKGSGTQTEVPGPTPEVVRKKVEFAKDFGNIGVSGWTLTDPPEYSLKVEQLKPLLITLAISQDASGAWHSYASSSDENTAVDIKLAGVNPYVLTPRWYEKIQLQGVLAGGQGGPGFGVLAGLGASYRINQFDIGPAFFVTLTDRVDRYFGATITWRPFQR